MDYRDPAPDFQPVPEDFDRNPEEFSEAPEIETTASDEKKEYQGNKDVFVPDNPRDA